MSETNKRRVDNRKPHVRMWLSTQSFLGDFAVGFVGCVLPLLLLVGLIVFLFAGAFWLFTN